MGLGEKVEVPPLLLTQKSEANGNNDGTPDTIKSVESPDVGDGGDTLVERSASPQIQIKGEESGSSEDEEVRELTPEGKL